MFACDPDCQAIVNRKIKGKALQFASKLASLNLVLDKIKVDHKDRLVSDIEPSTISKFDVGTKIVRQMYDDSGLIPLPTWELRECIHIGYFGDGTNDTKLIETWEAVEVPQAQLASETKAVSPPTPYESAFGVERQSEVKLSVSSTASTGTVQYGDQLVERLEGLLEKATRAKNAAHADMIKYAIAFLSSISISSDLRCMQLTDLVDELVERMIKPSDTSPMSSVLTTEACRPSKTISLLEDCLKNDVFKVQAKLSLGAAMKNLIATLLGTEEASRPRVPELIEELVNGLMKANKADSPAAPDKIAEVKSEVQKLRLQILVRKITNGQAALHQTGGAGIPTIDHSKLVVKRLLENYDTISADERETGLIDVAERFYEYLCYVQLTKKPQVAEPAWSDSTIRYLQNLVNKFEVCRRIHNSGNPSVPEVERAFNMLTNLANYGHRMSSSEREQMMLEAICDHLRISMKSSIASQFVAAISPEVKGPLEMPVKAVVEKPEINKVVLSKLPDMILRSSVKSRAESKAPCSDSTLMPTMADSERSLQYLMCYYGGIAEKVQIPWSQGLEHVKHIKTLRPVHCQRLREWVNSQPKTRHIIYLVGLIARWIDGCEKEAMIHFHSAAAADLYLAMDNIVDKQLYLR
jgi:hypothetical protein